MYCLSIKKDWQIICEKKKTLTVYFVKRKNITKKTRGVALVR